MARRALWPRPTSPPQRPSHLHEARLHFHGVCRLSHGSPGGGRSRACPRRCLLRRLYNSRRGGFRLPPLVESSSPIALLLLLVRRRVLRSRRGRESLLLMQPELLTPLFPALSSPDPLLLLVRRPLLFLPLRRTHARSCSGRGRVRPCGVHSHPLQEMSERSDLAGTPQANGGREDRRSTHHRAVGKHNE
jgi:hypothetical protein